MKWPDFGISSAAAALILQGGVILQKYNTAGVDSNSDQIRGLQAYTPTIYTPGRTPPTILQSDTFIHAPLCTLQEKDDIEGADWMSACRQAAVQVIPGLVSSEQLLVGIKTAPQPLEKMSGNFGNIRHFFESFKYMPLFSSCGKYVGAIYE